MSFQFRRLMSECEFAPIYYLSTSKINKNTSLKQPNEPHRRDPANEQPALHEHVQDVAPAGLLFFCVQQFLVSHISARGDVGRRRGEQNQRHVEEPVAAQNGLSGAVELREVEQDEHNCKGDPQVADANHGLDLDLPHYLEGGDDSSQEVACDVHSQHYQVQHVVCGLALRLNKMPVWNLHHKEREQSGQQEVAHAS